MCIPEGIVCIYNLWHCNHDRTAFSEGTDKFWPERYLSNATMAESIYLDSSKQTRQDTSRWALTDGYPQARIWLMNRC